ncbi:MAG TPA: hypothetical protein VM557_09855 [Thermoanaerobaculia bacterium]|nr:hypothetical protein [Thermoanaerobaculia bacterium]
MTTDLTIEGDPARLSAARALVSLMTQLRMGFAFVGDVARSAWLGAPLTKGGAVDLLALIPADRAGQIPMMASNRGFRVDPEEAKKTEELDLIPMWWVGPDEEVRVHVLFATNALYGTMVRDAVGARLVAPPPNEASEPAPVEARVVGAEDLALLLLMSEAEEAKSDLALLRRIASASVDSERLNRKLVSLGLSSRVLR